jgi:hypothetical protein
VVVESNHDPPPVAYPGSNGIHRDLLPPDGNQWSRLPLGGNSWGSN